MNPIKDPITPTAPAFGYDVEIELANGPCRTETVVKHWRCKRSSEVIRRAMQIPRARRVLKITPLTEQAWCAAYGDPSIKSNFN